MEQVRFIEPFRTVFYCTQYLGMALGFFEREGLAVDFSTASVQNGVARALLAGDADIGVSGPMRALGAADRGEGRLTCIAELNSRAGFFVLGRTLVASFDWRDLTGRRVLVFGGAPTPRLCLEYLLERHGVNLSAVDLVSNLMTDQAVAQFLSGQADYLLQGQPLVEQLVASGEAHLVAALGPALGPLAFSAYLVTPKLLVDRLSVVDAVLRALRRTQLWLHCHTPTEIAAQVAWAFPELDRPLLQAAISRYLLSGTWATEPVLRRAGFDALQEILLTRGFLRRSHRYEGLVNTERAEAAILAVGAA